jgi:hypothetical protein
MSRLQNEKDGRSRPVRVFSSGYRGRHTGLSIGQVGVGGSLQTVEQQIINKSARAAKRVAKFLIVFS